MTKFLAALGALAVGLTLALTGAPGTSLAQATAQGEPLKQLKLTEKHITSFISAQKDMATIQKKIQGQSNEKPDPKIVAEFEAAAKKHGFASFAEFEEIYANISMIMAGLDPQTGAFTDPIAAIKKEMEDVKKDAQIPAKDKKQMLDELAEALKVTEPIKFPENVELVKKFRQQIDAAMQ